MSRTLRARDVDRRLLSVGRNEASRNSIYFGAVRVVAAAVAWVF